MTNKEYFEQNNISFADALKEYDATKHGTIEQFLYSEREPKFKPGDIIVGLRVSGSGYGINIVLEVRGGFYVLKYRPIMNGGEWADDEVRICEIDQKCTKVGIVDDVMNVEDYILNTTDKAIIISNGHVRR